jgi:FAD:protein FMN transferase
MCGARAPSGNSRARRLATNATALGIATLGATALLAGCATTHSPTVLHGEGLGSEWTVKLGAPAPGNLAEIQRGIQARVEGVFHSVSRWDDRSEMSALNASARSDWQPVSIELFEPLDYAFTLAADTGGAFDPTVAPLVDAWGFGKAGRRYEPPSPEALSAARSRVGFEKVALDASGTRVRKPAGMQIDLSSMQHGRGADAVSEYLNSLGITRYLVDVGSEIRARGESPEGGAWHVAIERPPPADATTPASTANGFEHVVWLRDAGIATSGNFRYFFDYNGRRYSHRIDPRTGEPVSHDLVSVTVIDPICMHADALATALTVLGPDEGFEYAASRNIAALFISGSGDGLVEKMTPGFASYLK